MSTSSFHPFTGFSGSIIHFLNPNFGSERRFKVRQRRGSVESIGTLLGELGWKRLVPPTIYISECRENVSTSVGRRRMRPGGGTEWGRVCPVGREDRGVGPQDSG